MEVWEPMFFMCTWELLAGTLIYSRQEAKEAEGCQVTMCVCVCRSAVPVSENLVHSREEESEEAKAMKDNEAMMCMCRFAVLVSGTLVYSRGEEREEAKEVEEYEATGTPGRPPLQRPSAGKTFVPSCLCATVMGAQMHTFDIYICPLLPCHAVIKVHQTRAESCWQQPVCLQASCMFPYAAQPCAPMDPSLIDVIQRSCRSFCGRHLQEHLACLFLCLNSQLDTRS